MLELARSNFRSGVSVEDAVAVTAVGAVDGKQLWCMLYIMEATPREDVLWRLTLPVALGPHNVPIPTMQPKHLACRPTCQQAADCVVQYMCCHAGCDCDGHRQYAAKTCCLQVPKSQ